MFACRVALALGVAPSALDEFPATDLDLLRRYWEEEPWGALRDNLHAAMIAREVRRPQMRRGQPNSLDDFMYSRPERREAAAKAGVVAMLRAMAKPGAKNGRPRKISRPPRS